VPLHLIKKKTKREEKIKGKKKKKAGQQCQCVILGARTLGRPGVCIEYHALQ
jgi:hypothetical protein